MIDRIEASLSRWRRRISRSERLARLLKLSVFTGPETEPGLVVIQVDGLAYGELQQALQRGEMPFLRRLIDQEHYQLQRMYAGIPSTTPAVQGELFYGVKAAVPGFNFMPSDSGQLVRMYEPMAAAEVEEKLAREGGAPLLEGGSCYADNFTGGAAEQHFCPASAGWGSALRDTRLYALLLLIIANAYSFVRTAVLMLLELLLALFDFVRGIVAGGDFWAELKFIPTRVVISILLRELITIGVKIDIARGLPIIHLNFLGYDEQAHRRGPSSLFAHWTLQGIDDAIARIWRAAQRAGRRSYDVWVYSDHGQQQVQAYEKVYGQRFAAVAEVFSRHEGKDVAYHSSGGLGEQLKRIGLFGGERIQRFFAAIAGREAAEDAAQPAANSAALTVAAMGPVAHLYSHRQLTTTELSALAHALVERAKAPLVLYKNEQGCVRASTRAGEFSLLEDPVAVVGAEHPYLHAVSEDLHALCRHPDAGVLIACGYIPGGQALSFALENGAHGGTTINETSAFALVPHDITLGAHAKADQPKVLRALDLRHAALKFLGRNHLDDNHAVADTAAHPGKQLRVQPTPHLPARRSLRVMTYNVHSCIGMDGKLAPERIARVIARYAPDIVALQELDVGRPRTNSVDQARSIADCLAMQFHFHPALHLEEERYGDAILTHLPMRLVKSASLPGLAEKPKLEPRGALWVAIDAFGTQIQFLNTHLGLRSAERMAQVQKLLGSEWLGHPDCKSPVILCGDFNAGPRSREWRALHQHLPDAQVTLAKHKPKNTFFSRRPSVRIDHVFVDAGLEPISIATPNHKLVRNASDHLPLLVELSVSAIALQQTAKKTVGKNS